jgi:hypothetical protein
MDAKRRYFLTAGASLGLLGLCPFLPKFVQSAEAEVVEKF